MKIIVNKDGKVRDVDSVKKIVNVIHDAINNEEIEEYHVEIIINGNTLTWKDWIDLDEFKELNPDVEI